MKGVIVVCLRELILDAANEETWGNILEGAGLSRDTTFSMKQDVDDEAVIKAVESTCKELDVSLEQAADLFGDFWMNRYAPRYYSAVLKLHRGARDFLMAIDKVHTLAVRDIPGARPPRFEMKVEGPKTLVVTYRSSRGLIDFAVGLARGVGKHYSESLTVTKTSDTQFTVVFE